MQEPSSNANEDDEEGADKTQWGSMSSLPLCIAQRKCLDSRGFAGFDKGEETVRKGGVGHIHR